MSQTTIVLADDHPIVRVGVRTLLEKEQDFRIIGETYDGVDTVRTVKYLGPDVLVLDLMMPGMNGIYVTREVKKNSPGTRIIILSMHASESYIQEAFRNGADGYVLKDTIAGEIVKAIRTVMAGRRYIGELAEEDEIDTFIENSPKPDGEAYDKLTAREREILHLIAKGHHNKEIAEKLVISVRTVETHRARTMRKLSVRNQAELIHFAVQKKIITLQ